MVCRDAYWGVKGKTQPNNHDNQEMIHADWNDRSRKNGGEHGAAPVKGKAPMCGVQQIAKTSEGVGSRGSNRVRFTGGFHKTAREAPNDIVDGTGSRRGPKYRRPPAASRGRRHSH